MKAKQVAIAKGVTAQTVKIWIREGKLKANITPKGYDITEKQLKEFDKKWSHKSPHIAKSWSDNWANLVIFLDYPHSIRKIIYTTNSIESVNSQLRKVTKNKRVFPNDDAVFKTLFLTIRYITRKWTMPIQNWNETMAHFIIKFEGRF
jgi:transposase-like protein